MTRHGLNPLPPRRGARQSKEYEIERLYRDAPMLLIGEGTAEIQKMIIGRRLLERFRIAQ
jgi:alkylation response protein AidB-like acyl-CoA dehydrogenase